MAEEINYYNLDGYSGTDIKKLIDTFNDYKGRLTVGRRLDDNSGAVSGLTVWLNKVLIAGLYLFDNGVTLENGPDNAAWGPDGLVVDELTDLEPDHDNHIIRQTIFKTETSDKSIYIRYKNRNGTWSAWRYVLTNNDLEPSKVIKVDTTSVTDCDLILDNSIHFITIPVTAEHWGLSGAGLLITVSYSNTFKLQIGLDALSTRNRRPVYRTYRSGTWDDWVDYKTPIDATLTQEGQAADAKAVGDCLTKTVSLDLGKKTFLRIDTINKAPRKVDGSNYTWDGTRKAYVIYRNELDKIDATRITIQGVVNSYGTWDGFAFFLKSLDGETLDFCDGETGPRIASAASPVTATIPSDCKYIVTMKSNSSGSDMTCKFAVTGSAQDIDRIVDRFNEHKQFIRGTFEAETGWWYDSGSITASETLMHTEIIPIDTWQTIYTGSLQRYPEQACTGAWFDKDKNWIAPMCQVYQYREENGGIGFSMSQKYPTSNPKYYRILQKDDKYYILRDSVIEKGTPWDITLWQEVEEPVGYFVAEPYDIPEKGTKYPPVMEIADDITTAKLTTHRPYDPSFVYVPAYTYALLWRACPPPGAAYFSMNIASPAGNKKNVSGISSLPIFVMTGEPNSEWDANDACHQTKADKNLCLIGPSHLTMDRLYRMIQNEVDGEYYMQPNIGFQEYLVPWFKSVKSYAFSGQNFMPGTGANEHHSIYDIIIGNEEDLSGYDEFVVFATANSWSDAQPGDYETSDKDDLTKVVGALNAMVDYIYDQTKNNRTPPIITLCGYHNPDNTLRFDAYNEQIKKICKARRLRFFDAATTALDAPEVYMRTSYDGTHRDLIGNKEYGLQLRDFLLSNEADSLAHVGDLVEDTFLRSRVDDAIDTAGQTGIIPSAITGNPIIVENCDVWTGFKEFTASGVSANEKITICRKNIFRLKHATGTYSLNNANFTFNTVLHTIRVKSTGTGVSLGTSSGGSSATGAFNFGDDYLLPNGLGFNFKFKFPTDTPIYITDNPKDEVVFDCPVQLRIYDGTNTYEVGDGGLSLLAKANTTYYVYIFIKPVTDDSRRPYPWVGDITFAPQIEVGNTPTKYEVFSGIETTLAETGDENIFRGSGAHQSIDNEQDGFIQTFFANATNDIHINAQANGSRGPVIYDPTKSSKVGSVDWYHIFKCSVDSEGPLFIKPFDNQYAKYFYAQIYNGETGATTNDYSGQGVFINAKPGYEYAFRIRVKLGATTKAVIKPIVSTGIYAIRNMGAQIYGNQNDSAVIYTDGSASLSVTPKRISAAWRAENTYKICKNINVLTGGGIMRPFSKLMARGPMVSFIDDDTTSIEYVQRYHDIFVDEDVLGGYAVETGNLDRGGQTLVDTLLSYEQEGFACLYHCHEQHGDSTRYWIEGHPAYNPSLIRENFMTGLRKIRDYGFSNYKYWVSPYGVNNKLVVDMIKNHGMQCLLNCPSRRTQWGFVTPYGNVSRWNIPRLIFGNYGQSWIDHIKATIQDAINVNGWVTIVSHVNSWGDAKDQMTAWFKEIIEYCKDNGAEIVPFPIAFEEYRSVFMLNELL